MSQPLLERTRLLHTGNGSIQPIRHGYFPAVVCMVCDSPIDALVALCTPRAEATQLVTASWGQREPHCVIAILHGGRPIAALLTPEGRWAACNVFLDEMFATPQEAARRLDRLLRRGRRGYVGYLPPAMN